MILGKSLLAHLTCRYYFYYLFMTVAVRSSDVQVSCLMVFCTASILILSMTESRGRFSSISILMLGLFSIILPLIHKISKIS